MFLSSGIDTVMMSMYTNVSVGYNPCSITNIFFFLVSFCGLGASQIVVPS